MRVDAVYLRLRNHPQSVMNDIELRKFSLEKAVEILSWYKNYHKVMEKSPIALAETIYQYLRTGKYEDCPLPYSR